MVISTIVIKTVPYLRELGVSDGVEVLQHSVVDAGRLQAAYSITAIGLSMGRILAEGIDCSTALSAPC